MARLWLVVSVVWIAYWAWQVDIPCRAGIDLFGDKFWCKDPLAEPIKVYTETAALLFGPPLLLGAVMLAAAWLIAGFRR